MCSKGVLSGANSPELSEPGHWGLLDSQALNTIPPFGRENSNPALGLDSPHVELYFSKNCGNVQG